MRRSRCGPGALLVLDMKFLNIRSRRRCALGCVICAACSTHNLTLAQPLTEPTQSVVITGNPFRRADPIQPVTTLSGEALVLRRASTLGDTLDGLPGVSGTGFGPNSSRPVIRGLDGDRVRLLDNGVATIDASSLSFDHAPTIDPLVVERLEVLRGPAALLYGGNASGGVVNAIDNRIPRQRLDGLIGRAEVRLGGAASERSAAAVIEGGQGAWAWHADVFRRSNGDLRVPRYVPIDDGSALEPSNRVRNSAAQTHGAAVGAAWLGDHGRFGLSLDSYRNHYGVTADPDVTIRMRRERLGMAAQRQLAGPFAEVSVNLSSTRYQHDEVEGSGAIGTHFASRGHDVRVELTQRSAGAWRGISGLQLDRLQFAAQGEEAFVPSTQTRSAAWFTLQELDIGPSVLSAGARAQRMRVSSLGDASDAAEVQFGAASSRGFSPLSLALSGSHRLTPEWTLTAALGRTERAPTYYELFANGVHVATGAYERGDVNQLIERSRHVEAGLRWARAGHEIKAQIHSMKFANFIALDATGASVNVEDENGNIVPVPEFAFRGVPARFSGYELESRTRLAQSPWRVDLTAGMDHLHARNLRTGEPLPRIAPMRVNLGLELQRESMRWGAGVRHLRAQREVPTFDTATGAATLVNAWWSWRQALGTAQALWFVKLDNLGDKLAYNAVAIQTIRGLSPLPGRSIAAGLRVNY